MSYILTPLSLQSVRRVYNDGEAVSSPGTPGWVAQLRCRVWVYRRKHRVGLALHELEDLGQGKIVLYISREPGVPVRQKQSCGTVKCSTLADMAVSAELYERCGLWTPRTLIFGGHRCQRDLTTWTYDAVGRRGTHRVACILS